MKKAFYTDKELDALTSLTRNTRWRMRQVGEFPNPVKISHSRVGYPVTEIDNWIAERIAEAA